MDSFVGRGNQYIQLVKGLYCKLQTNGKQLPAFPLEVRLGTKPQPQKWEARVLPLCHCDPSQFIQGLSLNVLHWVVSGLFCPCFSYVVSRQLKSNNWKGVW